MATSKKPGSLKGKEIVVGVTGSIAAYKAAEVVSQLVQRDAGVTVVMTKSATQFVGPLTFQTLTRRRVMIDQFDLESVVDPTHITLLDKNLLRLLFVLEGYRCRPDLEARVDWMGKGRVLVYEKQRGAAA